ncbi:MAG: recombinase family protein [Candidatus Omnitrophica bacterium]|nr:recombinase family protein [Candidatus Omnitrophota bacterium]
MRELVIYCRTSMSDQNTETQRLALKEYCQRMNYKITDEYIDNGWSGKNEHRPQFERLLADVRAGKVSCVLVTRLDRVGRSLQHLISLFAEFKNRDIEFISLSENINTQTPEGKMFWQLLGVFAEYERELIVSRTRAGLARARAEGKRLGRPKGRKDSKPRVRRGHLRQCVR